MTDGGPALTRIEVATSALSFSAAHFTIFSATRRENLHGHSFRVTCEVSAPLGAEDLCFDYGVLKVKLKALCDGLDEKLLLPMHSPHLAVTVGAEIEARFAGEVMRFLPRDVLLLPIANITVEGLSRYVLMRLREDPEIVSQPFREMVIKVWSGPGQCGVATWADQ